jgi:hypothetical protein
MGDPDLKVKVNIHYGKKTRAIATSNGGGCRVVQLFKKDSYEAIFNKILTIYFPGIISKSKKNLYFVKFEIFIHQKEKRLSWDRLTLLVFTCWTLKKKLLKNRYLSISTTTCIRMVSP